MDEAAKSRATFIKSHLDWLKTQPNALKRQSTIRELRRYFGWWGESRLARDRQAIKKQFSRFHHHATLCIAAYGFLVAEWNRVSPSARASQLRFVAPGPAPDFRPRGSPRSPRAT